MVELPSSPIKVKPCVGVRAQAAVEIGRACDRDVGCRARRGLPCGRGHPGRTPFGNQYAMRAEGGSGPDDGPEIARVSDRIQCHDERLMIGIERRRQQVVGVGIRERRQLQRHALVDRPSCEPVELARVTSSRAVPRLAASLRMSRSLSSRSAPSATYAARIGISASIASSTALRPTTHSGPDPGRPVLAAAARAGLCWRAFFAR